MLGKTLRDLRAPRKLETSRKLADAIVANWREEREGIRPTMQPQDETWREFWLYASSAHDWCPRLSALETLFAETDAKQVIESELLWLFDQGHAYHDMFQQKILPCLPDGVFQGSWQRTVIDPKDFSLRVESPTWKVPDLPDREIVRGWGPRPEGDGWRYVESKVRFKRERIVVKVDGILNWPDAPGEVLEIKTEKMEARDSLNPSLGGMPREKHVIQANLGMAATGLTRGRLLYVFKGAPDLRTALVEHVLERDDALIERLLDLAFDCRCAVEGAEAALVSALEKAPEAVQVGSPEANAFYDALWAAVPPRLDACPMKSKGRARYCPGRELCFPAGYRKKEK